MKRLSLFIASIALAASSNAAVIGFQYGKPVTTSPTEIEETGFLGMFDSTLGVLTGAKLDVFGVAIFSFSGTSAAASSQNADLTSSTRLFWSSSLAELNPFLTDTIDLSPTSGPPAYDVGEKLNFGPISRSSHNGDDLASILASLQAAGGGKFGLTCELLSGLSVLGGGGNISTAPSTAAGCGASIVYTYDEIPNRVPEPMTLALLGMGLAGLGFSRRNRK